MKFRIRNFTIFVLLLFLVVAGLSGCACVPGRPATAPGGGGGIIPSGPLDGGEEEVSCLTTEEFLKILPDKWPEPWQETKRGCESGEDKDGCCETIGFNVAQLNKEGWPLKSIELWIYDEGTSAEAIDYSEFLTSLSGKEYYEKITYRGSPAYKEKGGATIIYIAAKRFVIALMGGSNSSKEELDLILGVLKVW